MPLSNGRPKKRKPRKPRMYAISSEFSGYVTTWPTRKGGDGKPERVPTITVEPARNAGKKVAHA